MVHGTAGLLFIKREEKIKSKKKYSVMSNFLQACDRKRNKQKKAEL